MARLFGTDGVRGLANGLLTAELALDLSVAAAHVLAEKGVFAGHRPFAVVGRDPRASGEFLSAAVIAGLARAGVDVLDAGVLPTPAVAFLTADLGADLGVMLSASHNAMPDNGIKFFARGGHKLADDIEDASRRGWASPGSARPAPTSGGSGRSPTAEERYSAHLLAVLPHRLDGLHVVVDCAHGAASGRPAAFERPGPEVEVIGVRAGRPQHQRRLRLDPPGERCKRRSSQHGADLGIALDGDADRCLAVDATGADVDGDQIMAVLPWPCASAVCWPRTPWWPP